jgi:hypothetical protein
VNTTVRTYETRNNTYHIIRIAKTTYEQQEEQKAERNYMIKQKSLGVAATIFSIIMVCNGLFPAILLTIVGIGIILTKDHVIG